MNIKLILQLSLFGLAMAIATVYWIPSNIEPLFWLAIFLVCAYLIAKKSGGRFFSHGLVISLVNSVYITTAHILLYDSYIANHAEESNMMAQIQIPVNPRILMLVSGPIIGLFSGIVLGFFAWIASRIFPQKQNWK
ncbi:MAG: hypothetical protein HXX13_11620 [Bacteroidetes bacterium]|nr:hypothetical protein [Bacteroidota bacterium]